MANRTRRKRDLSRAGTVHGRLTILTPTTKDGQNAWNCLCVCGNQHLVKVGDFKATISCGCYRREISGARNRKHGMHNSKAYYAWTSMRKRCLNPTHKAYKNYGGRSITIAARWDLFANFIIDMGMPKEGQSLDRINNDEGYSPQNCRWTDFKTQNNNRRSARIFNTAHGRISLTEAAKISGHSPQTLSWRLKGIGMTIDVAMTTPKFRNRKVTSA